MRATETDLPGVLLVETRTFVDHRGFFRESWSERRYAEAGLPGRFVQDNVSLSHRGVLRGLHFQEAPHAQGKLVSVLQGEIWDVAVDLRPESGSFGRWVGVPLSAEGGSQLFVPPGFAHGFVATSETALISYKCTAAYHPGSERTLLWNDPELGIEWPVRDPVLSDRDREGLPLRELRPAARVGTGR